MTVSSQNSYISYTGNDATTVYNFPYKLYQATDLYVYTVVIATGVETLQTSGGAGTYDYTIAYDSVTESWDVTLNNNLPSTHKLFLTRVAPLEQDQDYIEGDAFPAGAHEDTVDKIVLALQQQQEQLDRALKFKQSTATRSSPAIPELEANKLIKVNAAGDGFETQDTVEVSTIAGIAADVTAVSNIAADVTAVAADATDIGTVATNISSVNTVATNINDVITVANDLNEAVSEVETVADDLNEAVSEIDTVASNIADVQTVGNATNIANISTVAGEISPTNNISTLANISTDITTLANTSGLTTLANNSADISTVAGIQADVTAVANIDSAVSAVNSNATNINAVNANSANINAVNANSTNINTVATDLAGSNNIGTVASNLSNVNNFAETYRISATQPTTSLDVGDLWFDTANSVMKVYSTSGWVTAASAVNGTAARFKYTATSGQTTFTGADDNTNILAYDSGFMDVYLNGVKLVSGASNDYVATNGTSIVLNAGAASGDILEAIAYGTFELTNFSINDANDVQTTGVANNDVLIYNSTSSQFEPGTVPNASLTNSSITINGSAVSLGGSVTVGETKPTISSISPDAITNAQTSIVISGTNYSAVPQVEFLNPSTGIWYSADTVSFDSSGQLTVQATLSVDATYKIRIENPDGNAVISSTNILTVSDAPTWTTTAGSLGSVAQGSSISFTVAATSDSSVTYSKVSGSFPTGVSLDANTGVISGTESGSDTSETTYSFTLRATDAESQTVDRAFSITITVGITSGGQFN